MRIDPFLMAGLVNVDVETGREAAEKLLQLLKIGIYRIAVASDSSASIGVPLTTRNPWIPCTQWCRMSIGICRLNPMSRKHQESAYELGVPRRIVH
jgi:hypothetical protein